MSGDDKSTFYDSMVTRIKNNKFLAIGLLAVAGVPFLLVLFDSYGKFSELFGSQLVLGAVNVIPSDAAPFRDSRGIPCLLQDKVMRTFDGSERHPNSPLQLAFTFSNHAKFDALITQADFVVTHTQQVAGGGPGTVEPNHTYKMRLEFKQGRQPLVLNPPYKIPANETGAFAIDIVPAADGIGLCWVLYIEFKSNVGTIRTEPFAVTMSKSRR
jgi:hypothetical protein